MTAPRIGSVCTGYGGLDMAVQTVLGGTLAWVADPDPGAARILAHHHGDVPNLGDITRVDFTAVPEVDVLTAGFPCQDVSLAGQRAGLADGTRSGLWRHVARAIAQLRPSLVLIENVRGLLSVKADSDVEPCTWCLGDTGDSEPALRALGGVLADLAELGFDAEWAGVPASAVGAAHERFRVFIVAWPADAAGAGLEDRREGRAARAGAVAVPDAAGIGWGEGRPEPARFEGRPSIAVGGGAVAADTDRYAVREQPVAVCGRGGQALAGLAGCLTAADAEGLGQPRGGHHGDGGPDLRTVVGLVAADTDSEPREQRRNTAPGQAPGWRASAVDCGCDRAPWGRYAPAVHRWERVIGRAAPSPVNERGRLAPEFVEFLMGLPAGHVTAVPGLSRNAMLRALGNGVVPQQAEAALRLLLDRVAADQAAA